MRLRSSALRLLLTGVGAVLLLVSPALPGAAATPPSAAGATAATLLDGPSGLAHYALTLTTAPGGAARGALRFVDQDGRTVQVFSFTTTPAGSGSVLNTDRAGLRPLATFAKSGAVTLVGCAAYLPLLGAGDSCTFVRSPRPAPAAEAPAVTTTDPACITTPADFAAALLNALPEPDTASNVEAVEGWEEAEGGNWYNTAEFNPLNTTYPLDGSYAVNSVGVQSYASWAVGVTATADTLRSGYYPGILAALAAGDSAVTVADAVGDSIWGTPNFSSLLPPHYDPPSPSWQPDCTDPPPVLGAADLLSNASFGEGNFGSWSTLPAGGSRFNTAVYPSSGASQGSWFDESNTSVAGGSLYQDVAQSSAAGQSYTFSVWVRSRSGTPVSGTLALFALGGPLQGAATAFTVGAGWTLVSVPLDLTESGDTDLRAQLYESTPNTNYDIDGGQLVDDGLSNASFGEGNFGSWSTLPAGGSRFNTAVYPSSGASQGSWFDESNTSVAGGSLYQDVAQSSAAGQSYTFSVWVRSRSGTPVSGTLALFALGGPLQGAATAFTVGAGWTLVSVPLDLTESGDTDLRAQLYESTPNTNYDIDGGQLVDDGLSNASFGEGNFGSWSTLPAGGSRFNTAVYPSSGASQGSWFDESNTSVAGGSLYQDVAQSSAAGQSYTFSVWVRSRSGTPVSGTLALFALGGPLQGAATAFTVGAGWTLVSVPLDLTESGDTDLRAQLYESTPNTNYDIDGGQLAPGDD